MKTLEREPIVIKTDNSDIGMDSQETVYYPIEYKERSEFQEKIKEFGLTKEDNVSVVLGSNFFDIQVLSGETEKGWKYLAFYK